MSQIPASVDNDQFQHLLERLIQGCQLNILNWSLCSDATYEYESIYRIATVTLEEVDSSRIPIGSVRLDTGSGTITFVVDVDFLGLTPLVSPSPSDTTVEWVALAVAFIATNLNIVLLVLLLLQGLVVMLLGHGVLEQSPQCGYEIFCTVRCPLPGF